MAGCHEGLHHAHGGSVPYRTARIPGDGEDLGGHDVARALPHAPVLLRVGLRLGETDDMPGVWDGILWAAADGQPSGLEQIIVVVGGGVLAIGHERIGHLQCPFHGQFHNRVGDAGQPLQVFVAALTLVFTLFAGSQSPSCQHDEARQHADVLDNSLPDSVFTALDMVLVPIYHMV